MYKTLAIIITFIVSLLWVSPVKAFSTPPTFTSCPNPGGTLKVSYPSGDHGIPGDGVTYAGSDSVYVTGENTLVQCFCPSEGNTGIQTNWWQVSELSQDEIYHFRNLGWIFIPDGSMWGLNSAFYFAYNSSFNCGSTGGGGFSPSSAGPAPTCDSAKPASPTLISVTRNGSTATLTWSKVDQATHYAIWYGTKPNNFEHGVTNTGNVTTFTISALNPNSQYYWEVRAVNDCMPSDPAGGIGGGQVLGAFAPTGNMVTIALIAGLGLLLLGLSYISRGRSTAKN